MQFQIPASIPKKRIHYHYHHISCRTSISKYKPPSYLGRKWLLAGHPSILLKVAKKMKTAHRQTKHRTNKKRMTLMKNARFKSLSAPVAPTRPYKTDVYLNIE